MPVLPFIVEQYGAPESVYGLLLSCYAFFQFIGAPWLGRLSDSIGRKPVLLISQAGTLLSWCIFASAYALELLNWELTFIPLFVIGASRILDGITGGNNAVTQAYVADITTHEEKGFIFGTLGGIAGLGMIVGPGVGGLLASGPRSYLDVTLCGIALSAITLLCIHIFLQESLSPERRKPKKRHSILSTFRLIKRIRTLNPPKIIKNLFIVRALFSSMMASYIATIALFIIDLFHFSSKTLGMFMFFVGLFLAFNQAVVSKWMVKKTNELFTLKVGLALSASGMIAITQTDTLWLYICFYYLLNLGVSLTVPTFHALVAQHAGSEDTGKLWVLEMQSSHFQTQCSPSCRKCLRRTGRVILSTHCGTPHHCPIYCSKDDCASPLGKRTIYEVSVLE